MNTSLVDERLSLGVSVVLLLLYAANLIYTSSPIATCLPATRRAVRPNGVLPERWPVGSRPGAAAFRTTPLRRFRSFA